MSDLPPNAGSALCQIARSAIAQRIGVVNPHFDTPVKVIRPDPVSAEHLGYQNSASWLNTHRATFVTLTQHGALRGCIGSLTAYQPLRDDVAANAVGAAIRDPRFSPLPPAELADTRIEVSVLSEPEPLPFVDRADLLSRLRPGVDGLVLEFGNHRGTFLPQVWDSLPDPRDFLAQLVLKAGLPAGWWDNNTTISRYGVTAFEEP